MSNLFEHAVSRAVNLQPDKDYDLIWGLNGMISTKLEDFSSALLSETKEEMLDETIRQVTRELESEISEAVDTAVCDFRSDLEYDLESLVEDAVANSLTDSVIRDHVSTEVETVIPDAVAEYLESEAGKRLLKDIVYSAFATAQRQPAD